MFCKGWQYLQNYLLTDLNGMKHPKITKGFLKIYEDTFSDLN